MMRVDLFYFRVFIYLFYAARMHVIVFARIHDALCISYGRLLIVMGNLDVVIAICVICGLRLGFKLGLLRFEMGVEWSGVDGREIC